MARYSNSFINRVAQANDIVEVVGQFIALKKRGREFLGLCPFHDDHRPSLRVSPAKQIFKCFVCGAGGGVFQFLMQYQKLTFPEAVRQLAERAGIPLPREQTPTQADQSLSREQLVKLTTFAARYYREQLFSEAGSATLAYARRRGLTEKSIRRFGLGYAPDAWEQLTRAARKAGFTTRQLLAAGLARQREDGSCYDRLRHRLIFPILNLTGEVIAFGGRALDDSDPAKYLNSPETPLFDKSANLYALNWSRQAIVDSGQVVVVEGYLDALMCLQEGLPNVVATLGTALTDRHVRLLSRFAGDVVLLFDADSAGQAAAQRAIETFLTQRVNVRVAAVPQQAGGQDQIKDPCDYVLAAGGEAMRELVARAPDALEYAWQRQREAYMRAGTLAEKNALLEEFLSLVVSCSAYGAIDAVHQGLLVAQLAELVGVEADGIAARMRRLARQVRRATAPTPQGTYASENPQHRAERWILGALLNEPELFAQVAGKVTPAMFEDPALRAVAEEVWQLAGSDRLELAVLLSTERGQELGVLITDLQLDAERRGQLDQTVQDATEVMLRRQQERQLAELKARRGVRDPEVLSKVCERHRQPDKGRFPGAR